MIILAFLTEIVGTVAIIYGLWLLIRAIYFWHKRAMRKTPKEETEEIIDKAKHE